jgi:hypothetical protein
MIQWIQPSFIVYRVKHFEMKFDDLFNDRKQDFLIDQILAKIKDKAQFWRSRSSIIKSSDNFSDKSYREGLITFTLAALIHDDVVKDEVFQLIYHFISLHYLYPLIFILFKSINLSSCQISFMSLISIACLKKS